MEKVLIRSFWERAGNFLRNAKPFQRIARISAQAWDADVLGLHASGVPTMRHAHVAWGLGAEQHLLAKSLEDR